MEDSVFRLESYGPKEILVSAVAVLVSTLLLSWILRFLRARRYGSHRLPPGPKGWPLVGALPYLGEFPHKSMYELSKKYGPVMYMHLGSVPALVVSNGEMAKEVLRNNDHIFASRPKLLIPAYITFGQKDAVFAPYGPSWREARKHITLKLLTSARLAIFTKKVVNNEILSAIHTVLEQSQSGGKKNANISSIFNGLTMNIITMMLWNKRHRNIGGSQSTDDDKFEKLLLNSAHMIGANNVADFLPSFLQSSAMRLSGKNTKVVDLRKEFDSFFEGIIHEKEQAPVLSKEAEAAADEDDFVDVLLKIMNEPSEGSQPLSRESVKAILSDMIVAGSDTTAVAMDWILAQLLKHPDIIKKAQDELKTVVGMDRLVSESDIPNLKYLDAIVKEGLRLNSPTPLNVPHFSQADCKVGGYDVPANTTVFINIHAIHHDATVWENPWEFNPDRFLDSTKSYKGHNYDFIPFSSGRRMCPGLNLADSIVHIGLAQFLHTVSLSLPDGQAPEDIDMTDASGVTNPRATPLVVNAKPRLAHHVIYPATA